MNRDQANASLRAAFAEAVRPDLFIRGTCLCEECDQHNETMKANTPESMSLEQFGNPGWDPMCMANDQAFSYFLPGMVRLAFEDVYYADQLLFHLNCPGRVESVSVNQAQALKDALWVLVEIAPDTMLDLHYCDEAIRRLERHIDGLPC